jgi:hypothetical protein
MFFEQIIGRITEWGYDRDILCVSEVRMLFLAMSVKGNLLDKE